MINWMDLKKSIEEDLRAGLKEHKTLKETVNDLSKKYSYNEIITVLERGEFLGRIFLFCKTDSLSLKALDLFKIDSIYYALRADVGDCGDGKYDPLAYEAYHIGDIVMSVLDGKSAEDVYYISPGLVRFSPFSIPEEKTRVSSHN
ncbi:MAG: hypothetical protein ACP5T9_03105 [Thermoplasmata archaeon]